MQEIIPEIESAALMLSDYNHNVTLINLSNKIPANLISKLWAADIVLVTAYNYTVDRFITFLRGELLSKARIIFYLHGLASVGLWPLFSFKSAKHLLQSDIFISSSQRDADAFCAARTLGISAVIPFSLNSLNLKKCTLNIDIKPDDFVYVGRLSSQKNIHTLFVSLSLLNQQGFNHRLHLFGNEDRLGSPNMGFSDFQYLRFLENLKDSLGLTNNIFFHGFVERESLYSLLSKKLHIFISTSLHSDENFGMAALRSLLLGNRALLSDWGGHTDFKTSFPERVELVPVYGEECGPFINPMDLVKKMKLVISIPVHKTATTTLYTRSNVSLKLKGLIEDSSEVLHRVLTPEIPTQLISQRESFFNFASKTSSLFHGYCDPQARVFFKSYGMQSPPLLLVGSRYSLLPWATLSNGWLHLNDPHRGFFQKKLSDNDSALLASTGAISWDCGRV